jgi:4-amino-4-deoxy-L-arabinose transferase-like glycosyltransferase
MTHGPLSSRLLLVLAALALWRLLAASHAGMELYADEAQYWTWSLAPDWGYYSKPPMVAWAIWLGTALFGDGELGVRAASVLVYPATAWVLYLLVRRLFARDPRAEVMGFWAALTYASLPMVSLGSWLITTDAFLLLFWSLAMYVLVVALESGRWRHWLALGGAVGLGLMSKYSMVFFAPALLAYLLLTPERRRLLLDPRPYAAALVALLVLAPNMAWNAGHQFVSYQHTAEISQLDRALFHPAAMVEFFLAQFAVFGPITFAALLVLAIRPARWFADHRMRFLAAFALVPLAAFIGLSLLSRAFANWAAFSYVAAAALVAIQLLRQGRRNWLVAALALHLVLAGGMYHLHDVTGALGIQLTRKTDPYGRVTGNRALGAEVAERLRVHPQARLLGDDRKLFALMRYYARPYSDGARFLNLGSGIDNHYALVADVAAAPAGSFLLVTRRDYGSQLEAWFREATALPPIRLAPYPDYSTEYRVWLLKDYRGHD